MNLIHKILFVILMLQSCFASSKENDTELIEVIERSMEKISTKYEGNYYIKKKSSINPYPPSISYEEFSFKYNLAYKKVPHHEALNGIEQKVELTFEGSTRSIYKKSWGCWSPIRKENIVLVRSNGTWYSGIYKRISPSMSPGNAVKIEVEDIKDLLTTVPVKCRIGEKI